MRNFILWTIGYALCSIVAHAQNIVGNPLVTFNPIWYYSQWQCHDGTLPTYVAVGNNLTTITLPHPALSNNLNGLCSDGTKPVPMGQYEPIQYVRTGWNVDITHPHQAYWTANMRYSAAYPAPNGFRPFVQFGGHMPVNTVADPNNDNASNIGYIFNTVDLPGGTGGEQAMITATQVPGYMNYNRYFNGMNCGDPASGGTEVRATGQWGWYPLSYDGMTVQQIYSFPAWQAADTLGSQGGNPDSNGLPQQTSPCTSGQFFGPTREKWGFFIRPTEINSGGYRNTAMSSIYLMQWEAGQTTIAASNFMEAFMYDYLLGNSRYEGWCQAFNANNPNGVTNTCNLPNGQNFSMNFSNFCPQIFDFPSGNPDPWFDNPGAWPHGSGLHWQMIGCINYDNIQPVTAVGQSPGWTSNQFFSGFPAGPNGSLAMPGDGPSPYNAGVE